MWFNNHCGRKGMSALVNLEVLRRKIVSTLILKAKAAHKRGTDWFIEAAGWQDMYTDGYDSTTCKLEHIMIWKNTKTISAMYIIHVVLIK